MEQEDIYPINNSWIQDAATSLRKLVIQANNLLQCCDSNGNLILSTITESEQNIIQSFDENGMLITSAITQSQNNVIQAIDNSPTIVEVTTYTMGPRDTIFVHNPLPIVTPRPNQTVVYRRETIQPTPLVIDVTKRNAYGRVCGSHPEIECKRCVDAWLEAHKDGFELKDLTSVGTGCKIRKIHQAVSSKCSPPSSIVDRAAVKRYRECMARSK
jgi:hypothetical protein